jgi:spermidine/putrescine transport system substrate-binding protein
MRQPSSEISIMISHFRRPLGPRLAALACGALLAFASLTDADAAASETRELVLLNWADYIDPEVMAEFEQRFDAKVKEVYFDSDQERDRLMVRNDGQGYDLAIIDGMTLDSYRKRSWIAPLDEPGLPNLRHIEPRWRDAHRAAAGHAVPYFWGTLGIAYRSDLVPEAMTSWGHLFRPPESMRGRIGMIRDATDLASMALLALGHSPNSADPAELDEAEALLMAQRPYVRNYSYSSVALVEDSALVSGEIWAAAMYNGDALVLQEHDENIEYAVPDEGTILWVDYLAVLQSSRNKGLAFEFINFLNEPEIAARQAQHLYYPTPNHAAERFLPAEFLEDDLIYPEERIIQKSAFYAELSPRAVRRRASILSHLGR